jgi:RNA polymerase sigma factor (sigma-70 family)
MRTRQFNRIVQRLCLGDGLAHAGLDVSDRILLDAFLGRRDEPAFEAIVQRHGPMVLGVCRRILGNVNDAEDAFQAAFVVLARKAGSIRRRDSLGGWLYRVAVRAALEAKDELTRRHAREKQVDAMPQPAVEAPCEGADLSSLLDRELSRLPDKYRIPVVLCELEGRSRAEAARQLKLPEGTLSSRLATARKLLAKRLGRHGLSAVGGALTTACLRNAVAAASVPPALSSALAKTALVVAAGNLPIRSIVSARIAFLTEGVLKSMFLAKLKIGAAVVLTAMLATLGVAGVPGGPAHSAHDPINPTYHRPAATHPPGYPLTQGESTPRNTPNFGTNQSSSAADVEQGADHPTPFADQPDSISETAPVWGKPHNGLRLGLVMLDDQGNAGPRFRAILENVGGADTVLRLGVVLANGKKQVPTAFRLTFIEADGKKRIWQRQLGSVAGRIDPFVVPLGAGGRYRIAMSDFEDEEPSRRGVRLANGQYRVVLEFIGKVVEQQDTNPDMRGLALMPYWTGTIASEERTFEIGEKNVANTSEGIPVRDETNRKQKLSERKEAVEKAKINLKLLEEKRAKWLPLFQQGYIRAEEMKELEREIDKERATIAEGEKAINRLEELGRLRTVEEVYREFHDQLRELNVEPGHPDGVRLQARTALKMSSLMRQANVGQLVDYLKSPHGMVRETATRELVGYLNNQADRLSNIRTDDILLVAEHQGKRQPGLTGVMLCEKPRNFRLAGEAIGNSYIDIGSNGEQFWLWLKDDALYHCSYTAYEKGVRLPTPFGPELVVQAFGMTKFDPDKKYTVQAKGSNYELVEETKVHGQPVRKITVFNGGKPIDDTYPRVTAHIVQDAQTGKTICQATIRRVRWAKVRTPEGERGLSYPSDVVLEWPAEQLTMTMKISKAKINEPISADEASRFFTLPNWPNIKSIDLAK